MTRSCAWPGSAGTYSGITKLPSPRYRYPLALSLPAASVNVYMFGPLPMPPADNHTLDSGISGKVFPHNISFQSADWANERILDVILRLFEWP
ncbi:hypothetical protein BGY98DRAFT_1033075 [Russula aff. rugulosa BPL654]|nr:hypothetical protein BGY98DRAFT_1033075 [Russula aff. rugulosa BPL654]